MNEKTLIFLKPMRLKNPTETQKEKFAGAELAKLMVCQDLGKIYTSDMLPEDGLQAFIESEAKKHGAECLVCEDECATAAIGLQGYKRFLINPRIGEKDVLEPSDSDSKNVYGFFKDAYQQDYIRFNKVYDQAAWFADSNSIDLFAIHEWIIELIEGEEW